MDKVRGLPQTDLMLFGGKGCNPYVKVRLVRGNPIKTDEVTGDAVPLRETLRWRETYELKGMNPNFKQKMFVGPVGPDEKKIFLHVVVTDKNYILPDYDVGQVAINV